MLYLFSRIQRQMIALMSHFGQNECIIKKMANGNLFPEEHKSKAVKLVLEISTNCMTYAASIMGKGKIDFTKKIPNLLFFLVKLKFIILYRQTMQSVVYSQFE